MLKFDRIIVTGGRDYTGDVTCLNQLDFKMLIHGDAKGADRLCAKWAQSMGIHCAGVPALWDYYFKGAGFQRNTSMLILQPEYCVAFPGGKGTEMMVRLCENNNIPVWKPYG